MLPVSLLPEIDLNLFDSVFLGVVMLDTLYLFQEYINKLDYVMN